MDVDLAIDRLMGALERADVAPAPPSDPARVDEIAASISPLRLPAELVRFYERVDPGALGIQPHPIGAGLDFALQAWTQHRDGFPEMVPEALFPLCYESWFYLFVELDTPGCPGGRLFDWCYGGSDFRLRFASVTDWVSVLAEVVEEGAWTPVDSTSGAPPAVRPDPDVYASRSAAALGSRALVVPEQPDSWPPRWRVKSVDPDAVPRGVTHTIKEVRAAMATGPVSATIAGPYSRVAVDGRAGTRLSVVDGTGVLDVWCPSGVTRYHALGVADRIEFDVTAGVYASEWQPPSRPTRTPLASEAPNPPGLAFVEWLDRTPPEVVVTALRPLHRLDPGV